MLNEADIPAIVNERMAGDSIRSIAERRGVCLSLIAGILRGKSWKHVERPILHEYPVAGRLRARRLPANQHEPLVPIIAAIEAHPETAH